MENKGLLKLPETWHVVVTESNKEVLEKWFKIKYPYYELYCKNVGVYKWKKGSKTIIGQSDDIINQSFDFGQEITFADFKRLVLGEKNYCDYGVLGCEELSKYFNQIKIEGLDGNNENCAYFKNEEFWEFDRLVLVNRQTLPLEEYLKLIEPKTMEEMGLRCGKASTEFDKKGTETLIKRIEKRGYTVTKNNSKEIEKTMEKKYEYKLKDEKHIDALDKLTKGFIQKSTQFPISEEFYSTSISILKSLNVLDLFFKKIEVKELPIIGGSKPEVSEDGDLIEIAGFQIDMYIINHFKSFTLGNDVHVSESDIKQIREYLRKKII